MLTFAKEKHHTGVSFGKMRAVSVVLQASNKAGCRVALATRIVIIALRSDFFASIGITPNQL